MIILFDMDGTLVDYPYNTMDEVNAHLKAYWWHYNDNNPYRIITTQ